MSFVSLSAWARPFLLTAALQGVREATPKNPEFLGAAPTFSLPSLRELKLVTNADFAGRVVLLMIGRTDSPATQRDAGFWQELREKFTPRGFEVVAVSDENYDARSDAVVRALQFASMHKWEFPLLMNDGGEFHTGYYRRLRATPSGYLFHRNGDVDYLGQDPARAEYRPDLEALIERRLDEPVASSPASRPATPPLPEFTLVSWRGGAIRDTDLHGKPAILALVSAKMLPRFTVPLSSIAVKYGPLGLRVVAVVFGSHREVLEEIQARPPAFEVAFSDTESQVALVGDDYVPKFMFISSDSRIVKVITAIYGTREGVEGSVFERYAALMIGRYAAPPRTTPEDDALTKLAYRNPELGFGIDPPPGFKIAPSSAGARARFEGTASQELTIAFETRFGNNAESVGKTLDAVGTGLEARQVSARETRTLNGVDAEFVRESWSSALGTVQALRLLMPSGTGVYVVTAAAPSGDFAKIEAQFRASLETFHPGKL